MTAHQRKKKCHCQKWRPHKARRLFSKLIHAKEERNGPPSANQGLSTAKPRSSQAVCTLRVHPPTSPCPTLPAGAEPKSQGHCHKWHHKLKICWLKEKQPLNDIHETPNQQCRVRQRLSAQFSASLPATLPPALVHVRSLLTFQFVMDRLLKQMKNEEHGQREWLKSVYQLCCVPRVGTHLWSLVKASKEINKSSCTADMADVHASSQENESKRNRQTTSIHVPWRLHPSMADQIHRGRFTSSSQR